MGAPDRLEQREVRAERAVPARQFEQHGRARVALLVHRVAEPGHETPGRLGGDDELGGDGVPTGVVAGHDVERLDRVVEEARRVLGDAEEA